MQNTETKSLYMNKLVYNNIIKLGEAILFYPKTDVSIYIEAYYIGFKLKYKEPLCAFIMYDADILNQLEIINFDKSKANNSKSKLLYLLKDYFYSIEFERIKKLKAFI